MFCVRKDRREDFTYSFCEPWVRAKMRSQTKYDFDTHVAVGVSSRQIGPHDALVSTTEAYELLFQNSLKRPILLAEHDEVADADFVEFFHTIC